VVIAKNIVKFEIPLFDGKTNFTFWQSTIKDVLVRQGLDLVLEEEKPPMVDTNAWGGIQKKEVSIIQLALGLEIKYNVLKETTKSYETREHLCIKVVN